MTALVTFALALVLTMLLVVLVVFDLALLREIARWMRPGHFRTWWATPPCPWQEDPRSLCNILRAAWQTTRRWLRI